MFRVFERLRARFSKQPPKPKPPPLNLKVGFTFKDFAMGAKPVAPKGKGKDNELPRGA